MTISQRPDDMLLVVDMQYDFLPGGSLAVTGGDEIILLINQLGRRFKNVAMTQDWHPAGHISFASSHDGAKPFEIMQLPYGPQVLWPDHCVQGTRGAEFSSEIELPHTQLVIRKGYHDVVDSLFRLPGGGSEDQDRAGGLSRGTRHQAAVRCRARHRFLRQLDGGGRCCGGV